MSERVPFCIMCLVGDVASRMPDSFTAVDVGQGTCATTLALVATYGIAPVRAALCEEHEHRKRVDELVAGASTIDPRARA